MEEDMGQTTCKQAIEEPAVVADEITTLKIDETEIPSTSKAWSNRNLTSQSEESIRTPSSEAMSVVSQPMEIREVKSIKQLEAIGRKLRASRKKKRGVKRPGKKRKRGRAPVKRYAGAKKRPSPYHRSHRSGSDLISEESSRDSMYSSDNCKVCGHRTCSRRRHKKKKSDKTKNGKTTDKSQTSTSSADPQMSPLCIKTCPVQTRPSEDPCYCEINPHMLHQALRTLSKWTETVTIEDLAVFLASHYPVNPNDTELLIELLEKLRIAELCHTVIRVSVDGWKLPGHLEKRRLSNTHVSQFWQIYTDTIKPIKRPAIAVKLKSETNHQVEEQPDYIA